MAYRQVQKGERIAEYVLVEKLGQGGFGEVWKAEHAQIPGKYVAVKIPSSLEAMDFLKQEAVFQHELDHPNIVKTIGLNTQYDPPYFTMEYVEGKNLRQLMTADGILPPPYAIDIAVQVCEALAFAHGKGIVHKDIKPENILVEKKKVDVSHKGKALLHYVKVTDLGLGKFPDRQQNDIVVSEGARTSGLRMLSGTLFYMAPEQMAPSRGVDGRADLYSLGVVLYEMLTGELPLGMDLPSELNPVVTPELDAITKKALSIDRDKRYANAREMAADLQRAKEAFLVKLVASGTPALEMTPSGELRRFTPQEIPLVPGAPAPARRRLRWSAAVEWGLLAFVLALLGVASVAFLRLHRAGREREAGRGAQGGIPILPGSFVVNSKPDEADIALDGRRVGKTRLDLRGVSYQRHTLAIAKEFHEPCELILEPRQIDGRRHFALLDRATQKEVGLRDCSAGFTLEDVVLVRRKGHVRITTPEVENADVEIDGNFYGVTGPRDGTPFSQTLDAGWHHFRISKKGYKDLTFHEKVEGGVTIEKEVSLLEVGRPAEPAAKAGPIPVRLTSIPSGALVYLEGLEKGSTPCSLDLPAGEYELRLLKKHYEPRLARLHVDSAKTESYELVKIACRVSFESEPSGAAVTVDGVPAGTTPATVEAVEGGPHTATFRREGHFDQSITFEVLTRDPMAPLKAKLLEIPPGQIAIDCEIKGVEAFLDGKSVGRTPLAYKPVPRGPRRVRLLGVERTLHVEPGEQSVFFSLKDVGMVRVPEGEFPFGSSNPSAGELPSRVERTGAFLIDRFEVTNEQYSVFYAWIGETKDHGRCHPNEGPSDHKPFYWGNPDYNIPNHPVVGVSWFDAYAYAAWAGKRLPTEREWEKAARGATRSTYPWGNDWNDGSEKRCNWGDGGRIDGWERTSPVGACPGQSPYGCYDMVGNVAEWCADDISPKKGDKVVRGGSYLLKDWTTTTVREHWAPHKKDFTTIGFRCVADEKK